MMYCPITYTPIADDEMYSPKGLRLLSPRLNMLKLFPYSAAEQRQEAALRANKMSIQGVQSKLSAKLNPSLNQFDLVNQGGTFIIKPESYLFPELPANEDLTMRMASLAGIEVPLHGLLRCKDGNWSYFIKRFDREMSHKKIALEDFAQLSGRSRDTKYNSSIEALSKIIQSYCTFPMLEHLKLFERLLFCYLTGNEDMHLKNFSLIRRQNKVELSPAYDLLNSTIVLRSPQEEFALPLRGKRNKLKKTDLFEYLAHDLLNLNQRMVNKVINRLHTCIPQWQDLIDISFLSPPMKKKYKALLQMRLQIF